MSVSSVVILGGRLHGNVRRRLHCLREPVGRILWGKPRAERNNSDVLADLVRCAGGGFDGEAGRMQALHCLAQSKQIGYLVIEFL